MHTLHAHFHFILFILHIICGGKYWTPSPGSSAYMKSYIIFTLLYYFYIK